MDFTRLYRDLLWKLHRAVMHRIEQELERFATALEAWIYNLERQTDCGGWRSSLAEFFGDWQSQGLAVEAASASALEAWIASWAGDDRPAATAEEHSYVVSVTPNVSGPPASSSADADKANRARALREEIVRLDEQYRRLSQSQVKQYVNLKLTDDEKAEVEQYWYLLFWHAKLGAPPPPEPWSLFEKRMASEASARAQGSISAEPERTAWERERHEEELRARKFDWAFQPENARNPEAKRIRVDAYLRNGQMISPYIPMVRQDIQEAFVMLAGPLGEVGAPVLLVSGGVHAYYGEYAEALMDVAPVAALSIARFLPKAAGPAKPLPKNAKVVWVDEAKTMKENAYRYQSGAQGARSNVVTRKPQAPALTRTVDGKPRLVKFDGEAPEPMIDRKRRVVTTQRTIDQSLRQSAALRENGMRGLWEVPNEKVAAKARKLLEKIGVDNIDVRVHPE